MACGERINAYLARCAWYPGPCVGMDFKRTSAALRDLLARRRAS